MKLVRLLPLALVFCSCGERIQDPDRRDRQSPVETMFLTITDAPSARGTPEAPLPYATSGVTFTLRIEARGRLNELLRDFDGYVQLGVTPGILQSIEGAAVEGRNVRLTGGVAEGVRVTFARAYGETRLTVEEAGYLPHDPNDAVPPACADGMDNDGDGRADFPADYGCAAPNDDTERAGSYAQATSEPIYFASPRLSDVQGHGSTSPLINERITVTEGTLVVTRINVSGFWVTDIADTSCGGMPCYNSIFMFNFRLPEGLRPCDRLSRLQGTVAEFVSTTQFSQPAWTVAPDGLWIDRDRSGECPIPDATVITAAMLNSADTSLEALESGLVRIENATFSPNIGPGSRNSDEPNRLHCMRSGMNVTCDFRPGVSNCDLNNDNRIDYTPGNGVDVTEGDCANVCQRTAGCSEWTNWLRFGQLAVDLPMQSTTASRIIIAPREAIANFDPEVPPATGALAVTGTLKQVGPNWIIEPRCTQDLVLNLPGQTVLRARESCLLPRTVTEEP